MNNTKTKQEIKLGERSVQQIHNSFYLCLPKIFIDNHSIKKLQKVETCLDSDKNLLIKPIGSKNEQTEE